MRGSVGVPAGPERRADCSSMWTLAWASTVSGPATRLDPVNPDSSQAISTRPIIYGFIRARDWALPPERGAAYAVNARSRDDAAIRVWRDGSVEGRRHVQQARTDGGPGLHGGGRFRPAIRRPSAARSRSRRPVRPVVASSPKRSAGRSRSAGSTRPTRWVSPAPTTPSSSWPGVTIELDTTNFDPQKFAAQAASGNVPDLLQMDRSVVATLADKDLIVPLDECYQVHGVTPDQQYYPSTIGDVTYDGKVYAVPQFFQPLALLANKRVLEKAGVTARPARHLQAGPDRRPGREAATPRRMASRRSSASIRTCPGRRTCGSRSSAAAPTTTPASPRWTTRTTSRR